MYTKYDDVGSVGEEDSTMMKRPLCEYVKQWLEKYKLHSVKPSTYDRLLVSYDALLRYPIAHTDILTLKTEDLQDYVNALVRDGYAQTTIKKQFHLISGFMRYANAEGIIPYPIQNNVKLPTQSAVKKKKKEVESYTKQEQVLLKRVLNTMAHPTYGAVLLMLETGLRVGEVLALSWSDIQWNRRALQVNKTFIRLASNRRMELQEGAKSHSSNRIIPLSTDAMKLLERMYETADNMDGLIFCKLDGSPFTYEAIRWHIQGACEKAGVPYKGQHVFRHTFATNCYYRGCDVKILSKLLGHADVTVTYNTYIHLFGDALEEMRSVVG